MLRERPPTGIAGTQVYKDLWSTIAPFAFILSEVVRDEFYEDQPLSVIVYTRTEPENTVRKVCHLAAPVIA